MFTPVPAGKRISTPEGITSNISFRIKYKDSAGVIKESSGTNICWGFFSDPSRIRDKIGEEYTELIAVTYLFDKEQADAFQKHYPENLVRDYVQLLSDAGVAQWFEVVPRTLDDMRVGCTISANYPSPMMVGLMEMYRNLHYHPQYCAYAVELYQNHGISPGAALILPKILRMQMSLPSADAFAFSSNDSSVYLADVFSERHILKCIEKAPYKPMNKNADYHGVYKLFNAGYSKGVARGALNSISGELLNSYALVPPEQEARNRETDYGAHDTGLIKQLSTAQIQRLAAPFELTYERGH